MSGPERCAELSERAGERLAATAASAVHWLLIEVAGTWPRDVADGAGLPDEARRALREWLEATPFSRLLFIRRPGRATRGTRLAFVVRVGGDQRPEVRRMELSSPHELAGLELSSAGDVEDIGLVLVCGHGTRDACCALRGTAVYGALAERLEDDQLWISSHQGGHRFAANVLVLPHGIHLGRVPPVDAARLVERALSGRIDLAHYRGRVGFEARTQAADRIVREQYGLHETGDLELVAVDGDRVVLRQSDGREHVVLVEEHVGPSVPASCGATAEPQSEFSARLV